MFINKHQACNVDIIMILIIEGEKNVKIKT